MSCIWIVNNDVSYTANNGHDKLLKPIIPYSEFLKDCFCVSTFVEFYKIINDMIEKEIKLFPKHMKDMALNDIKKAKRAYLEKARNEAEKAGKKDTVLSFLAKENCLTIKDAKNAKN